MERFLAQMRAYWAGLSRARRIAVIAAGIGVFAAVGVILYLSGGTTYRSLYPGIELSPEEAGAITTKLTAQAIPNRLALGGTVVEVPEDRHAQARVAVASEGLPARGGKGYELFDETSLMTTPFVQSVNYQRALQAELARSIMQLESVLSARVMIARSEPTPFIRDQRPPTASVIIRFKPGSRLNNFAANSVVSLVARSVDGLKPENVTIVDTAGRLLSDPHAGDRDNLPTPQLEYRRELETYLSNKAEQMLASHLGPGRAIIRVSADINFQKMKERSETYSTDGRVAISERVSTSTSTGASSRGVAGATNNLTRAGGTTPGAGGGGGTTKTEELGQDYIPSKTVRDIEDRMGGVTRLTIAAMVDLASPTEGATMISVDDAQEIIKQAVGFRSGRDEVKLSNVRLTGPVGPQEPDETLVQLQRVQAYVGIARNVSLALAVVLVVVIVALLTLRRRRPVEVPPTPAAEATTATPTDEDRRKAELGRLVDLARTAPDRVAEIFRVLVGSPAR